MLRNLFACLLGVAALAGCASVPDAPQAGSADLAIVGVTVIPMAGAQAVLADRTVIVRDGRIAAIGPRARLRVPAGARVIEGRGRYLMPGLADMHVHLEYFDDPEVLKLFLKNGVTTVRSMDGRPFILGWRDGVAAGRLAGPRIVTAGPILDGAPPARDDNLALADPAAGRAAVAEQAALGYDFVKVYTNLSAETHSAILAEAKARGLRVAGHVPRKAALADAVRDQWSIEHLGDFASAVSDPEAKTPGWARRFLGAPLDARRVAKLAGELAAAGVWIVPTSVQKDRELAPAAAVERWVAEEMGAVPAGVIAGWRAASAGWAARLDTDDWTVVEQARLNRLAMIAALHRAGVRIAIGSDTPNPFVLPGISVHLELANFVAAGLTPAEALAAATIAPARMLGLEKDQGSVEVGKRADLLLLSANPLDSVANASARVGLIMGGRWYAEEELRAMNPRLGGP